ncbi:DUF4177 domain-containing protein [Citreicella sp. C3M06]|uniref:DUF4177 domain-containing protein n=1 Tax=Citreicella sp. C3M06 TaxID=2841564 RepID=UPI001C093C92|nr:DUF4177 domain-containing protein [Citreicella sp. C3M06]MBU2963000.1 DUF4177 domain-containing protein [Citreicella sp. C3M06]
MTSYEYKVVPAPQKGEKARGVKSAEGRFAHAIERAMNDMAAQGWEYLRAETLPSEERSGLTSTANVWRNLLVFRRARAAPASLEGRRLASAADLARGSENAPPVSGPLRLEPTPPSTDEDQSREPPAEPKTEERPPAS